MDNLACRRDPRVGGAISAGVSDDNCMVDDQAGWLPYFSPVRDWCGSERFVALLLQGDVPHGEDTVAWGKLALLGPVAYSPQVGAVWHQDADNRSDVGKPISANYMLFLESALKLDWLTDEMREGIWINRDIEAARTAGLMPLYFHDSPERIDAMTAEAKAMLIEIRDRFADQLVPSIEAESHSLPAMNY
jgi:hypothetical protein